MAELTDGFDEASMRTEWLSVKVYPKASKNVLVCVGPGRFEAWVTSKPIAGRANAAVAKLLAHSLEIPEERLRLVKGMGGRHKVFRIQG